MDTSVRIRFGVATMAAAMGVMAAARSAEKAPPRPPAIAGAWTGTWGPYVPPVGNEKEAPNKVAGGKEAEGKKASPYAAVQMKLDCKVTLLPNGEYEATFEGDAGRPYKYTIKMNGRAAGSSVLFKGTTDLGEKDGGVYDWIGRATEKEFQGFYTSSSHSGVFTLARPK